MPLPQFIALPYYLGLLCLGALFFSKRINRRKPVPRQNALKKTSPVKLSSRELPLKIGQTVD